MRAHYHIKDGVIRAEHIERSKKSAWQTLESSYGKDGSRIVDHMCMHPRATVWQIPMLSVRKCTRDDV